MLLRAYHADCCTCEGLGWELALTARSKTAEQALDYKTPKEVRQEDDKLAA